MDVVQLIGVCAVVDRATRIFVVVVHFTTYSKSDRVSVPCTNATQAPLELLHSSSPTNLTPVLYHVPTAQVSKQAKNDLSVLINHCNSSYGDISHLVAQGNVDQPWVGTTTLPTDVGQGTPATRCCRSQLTLQR